MSDLLGDRIKAFESLSTSRRAFKGQPIIVRLDGKSFHTFTRGLRRPYDEGLTNLMIETTKHLVEKYHANLGYTQSDEITLMFYIDRDSKAEYVFGGRFQKLESLLAASASVFFNKGIPVYLPTKIGSSPVFDARAFIVPTLQDAYDCFLWRQLDATKNAVSMAAHSYFSHKSLQGMHSNQMQERLFSEKGINFNNYPTSFRRGTFVIRDTELMQLSHERLMAIPEQHREKANALVQRTKIKSFDMLLASRPTEDDMIEFIELIS